MGRVRAPASARDFPQIMIGGRRGLGLPAAYVSGYRRTIPPPGQPRPQGADATHAWVLVWTGRQNGWVEFDPTNAMQAGTHRAGSVCLAVPAQL
jgi:transglutaminase-like putative cysteine protease